MSQPEEAATGNRGCARQPACLFHTLFSTNVHLSKRPSNEGVVAVKCFFRYIALTTVVSACFSLPLHAIPGQPGTLDNTWGTLGRVVTAIGSGADRAYAMALQPDGKVLLAGECFGGTNNDFCVARYNASGSLDATWNGNGKVITAIGTGADRANAMALQPDGKVLLAGYCVGGASTIYFCAARYNANGTPDLTWNGTGKGITPISTIGTAADLANAMALQPDGKVLLAGYCSNGTNDDFCSLRYNADGTLDSSWGGTGKVITAIGTANDRALAMALQPDGKVLLAGLCSADFCAARYNANGTLDNTWNGTGKVTTSVALGVLGGYATAMALQPDGKLLLAGRCGNSASTNYDFCSARYNAIGTLDTTWNGTGKLAVSLVSSDDWATGMTLQPDGKVLMTGQCAPGFAFCAARYNGQGTLDTTWNFTGLVTTSVGPGDARAQATALQPDGKLLVAGYCSSGIDDDFCVTRYDGGPFGYQNCKMDIDGDGSVLATTDSLIHARIALGITGAAVINGITFPATATRNTWPLIRDYLVTQCGLSLVP
jgi:uncharacterized delta-60 repeat protein